MQIETETIFFRFLDFRRFESYAHLYVNMSNAWHELLHLNLHNSLYCQTRDSVLKNEEMWKKILNKMNGFA